MRRYAINETAVIVKKAGNRIPDALMIPRLPAVAGAVVFFVLLAKATIYFFVRNINFKFLQYIVKYLST